MILAMESIESTESMEFHWIHGFHGIHGVHESNVSMAYMDSISSICRGTIHVSLGSNRSLFQFPYIYMIFLLQRILLAVLDAAVRCSGAQPFTPYHGASGHLNDQVTAAELFYLRNLRSCAASASGKRSTCSGGTSSLCTSCLLLVLDCIMSLT